MFNGAPVSPFTNVPGWESLPEQGVLIALTQRVPENGMIVEIGAEFGMSASLFCQYRNAGVKILSVDLFPGNLMDVHRANLEKVKLGGRSRQIKGDSAQIGRTWTQGGIDLLFVDGDHSYEGVKRDITAWMQHVKPGGYAVFHDAAPITNRNPHPLHFEVQRAIDEWQASLTGDLQWWVEQESVDSMRIFLRETDL